MATAKIDVKTDLHGSDKELKKVTKEFGAVTKQAEKGDKATKALWKQFATGQIAVAGLNKLLKGAGGLAKSFLNVAVQVEGYQVQLKTLLGSQEAATKAFDFFSKVASDLPFTLQDVIQAGTRLAAIKAPFEKWLPRIADLASAIGFDLPTATDQMARAMASGLGSADLFREKGVSAMIREFAKLELGIKDVSRLTLPELQDVLFKFTGEFSGASEEMAGTWTGITSMLSDAWFQFQRAVMDAGVFELLKGKLSEFLETIQLLIESGELEAWAERTAKTFKIVFDAIGEITTMFKVTFKEGALGASMEVAEGLSGITAETDRLKKEGVERALAFRDSLVHLKIPMSEIKEQFEEGDKKAAVWMGQMKSLDDQMVENEDTYRTIAEKALTFVGILEDSSKPTEDLKDEVLLLNPALFDAEGKVRLLETSFKDLKTPTEILEQAIEDATDKMSDFPVELAGVPGTIEGILDSINFGKVSEDAAAAGLESSLELAAIGADLEKATAEQLKAMEDQAKKTEEIIQGVADSIGAVFKQSTIDILEGQRTLGESIGDIWKGIKSTIFGVIGDIVKEFITNLVKNVITGAVNMGTAMTKAGGVMEKTGKAISGIGEGIGKLIEGLAVGIGKAIEALAKSIAAAAKSLAAAAPQLLVVGAVAVAIFAGFSAIKALFAGGGGKVAKKGNELLQDMRDFLAEIRNEMIGTFKPVFVNDQQSRLNNLIKKADWNLAATEGILGYQEAIKDNLDAIKGYNKKMLEQLESIPKSASGGFFTKPSLTFVAEKEPEVIIPQSKLKQFFNQFGPVQQQPSTGGSRQPLTVNFILNGRKIAEALVSDLKELSRLGTLTIDQQGIVRVET